MRIKNGEVVSLLIDEERTHGHRSLQLKCLPVWGIEGEGDGIVLDTRLCFLTQLTALRNHIHEFAGNGDLTFWFLAQRHADGVANTLCQQGTNAHSRLDASVLTFACLGDT